MGRCFIWMGGAVSRIAIKKWDSILSIVVWSIDEGVKRRE